LNTIDNAVTRHAIANSKLGEMAPSPFVAKASWKLPRETPEDKAKKSTLPESKPLGVQ
jgi:hypothetical protein